MSSARRYRAENVFGSLSQGDNNHMVIPETCGTHLLTKFDEYVLSLTCTNVQIHCILLLHITQPRSYNFTCLEN